MMHQNYSREDTENRFNQNPVVQKRSAFTNLTNVTNGKQMLEKGGVKKMDVKKTNPVLTRNNTFGVQPQPLQTRTNLPLQQTRQPLQVNNNTKISATVLPKTNFVVEQSKVQQKKKEEEEVDEIEDEEEEDLLDMSISMDDMSNMSLENIDEYDHEDPTCCSELVNEIYGFLRQKETSEAIQDNYFDTTQKDINQKMRTILIDWLVDVHSKFKLLNDTLFMAVSLIDRFLEKESVSRKKLQLVGVTAMFIASKFEEIYAPEVGDFVYICDKAYTKEEILQYEIHILNTLSFEISHPTPIHFLRRFSKAAKSDNKTHTLSKYLIELSLMEFELQKKPFTPSLIAASSIYITRKMINPKLYWNSTLRHYTQYKESEIMPCVQVLNDLLKKTQKGGSSLNAIYRKYSTRYFGVANIPHVEI